MVKLESDPFDTMVSVTNVKSGGMWHTNCPAVRTNSMGFLDSVAPKGNHLTFLVIQYKIELLTLR